jgi:ribosomal protein S6
MDENIAKDDVKVYEIGFHIAPIVGEDNIAHEVGEIKGLLEKIKATIISEDFPRQRTLAYPLSKMMDGSKKTFKEAYFGWIKFEVKGESVSSLSKEIEKMGNILRYLLIKTDRENTLYGNKLSSKYEGKAKPVSSKSTEPKVEVDEVEVDKAIDELVV